MFLIFFVIIAWLLLIFLTFGAAGLYFVVMVRASRKPWPFEVDDKYLPKISMIIPTFNEASVIELKLLNVSRLDYPSSLLRVIVVDSNSNDGTLDIAKDFGSRHPSLEIKSLSLPEKGKTAALNLALRHVEGDVVVVSDADCFYEKDVLRKVVPYLSVSDIGAVSGVKLLLNSASSTSVMAERRYLKSMNRVKLGESKLGFTPLFEGGLSAYKSCDITSFDPYNTGSDDCGTVVRLAETGRKAVLVSEAVFFTGFPTSWGERLKMKVRRANQLVRVFGRYFSLLLQGRVKVGRTVILADTYIYLFGSLLFAFFLVLTPVAFFYYPLLLLVLLLFAIPRIGSELFDLCQSYFLLFLGLVAAAFGRKALIWDKPKDRSPLNKESLTKKGLI